CKIELLADKTLVSNQTRNQKSIMPNQHGWATHSAWANSRCGRKSFRRWTPGQLKNENKNRKKLNKNMNKTIEQIAAVAPFDRISALDSKAALKGNMTGQRPLTDILKSMLTSLSEGRITDFVTGFQSPFKFTDHALNLEFREHQQLTEFLEKSRELFPDTVMDAISVFQSGDTAIAEWKLTATETISAGSMKLRAPILLSGVSIAQFNRGKITRWTDYYDQLTSRRIGLAAFFTEWVEL